MSNWIIQGWWHPSRYHGKAHRYKVVSDHLLFAGYPGNWFRSFCGKSHGPVAEPREIAPGDENRCGTCAKLGGQREDGDLILRTSRNSEKGGISG